VLPPCWLRIEAKPEIRPGITSSLGCIEPFIRSDVLISFTNTELPAEKIEDGAKYIVIPIALRSINAQKADGNQEELSISQEGLYFGYIFLL
jgi:hypothetical protein